MTNICMIIGPGRYRLTRQALESLLAHTIPGTYTLTMVLDEAGFREGQLTDRLIHDMPDELATSLHVRSSGHTLSQIKNLGVAWSEQRWGRGDWLYISDSDVYFLPGWLEKLRMVAESGEPSGFALWGGQIHPFHQPDPPDPMNGRFGFTEHKILDGPSWLMRWSTWDQYGPFDRTTAPGVCQSEEYPFCQRLTAPIYPDYVPGPETTCLLGGGRIGVIHPHVIVHCGLTHLDGHDCVGRKERESMIPKGVLAE